ncbi:MAG: type II toxin-antitoxin system HipA family toxin [Desulfobacula sp.]|nr:type II toxin-antitoxin system HipA family toxin [Desulfobacula sp.]
MKKLNVFLYRNKNNKRLIGTLAQSKGKIYFEYDQAFIGDPLWLSPFKLPPDQKIHEHKDLDFGPIFGLFDDSLPDGWGLLLMDQFLRKRGVEPAGISVLDRLSFVGQSTMGALTYEPAMDFEENDSQLIDIHELSKQSQEILSGKTDTVLPQLMRIGGSAGGARPKILVGVSGDELIAGGQGLAKGYEHWIVKFNAENDFPDAGVIEYAYSLMAVSAGLKMTETRIFKTESGDRFFGTKRFDRNKNNRFHVHTFGNLIHSYFRVPSCDYIQFLKVTRILTRSHQEVIRGLRQMIFNVLTNNRDDHVKNFAFMLDKNREWQLTPAYDLTFCHGPGGQHSMSVSGEGAAPGGKEIIDVGTKVGLAVREIKDCLDQVMEAVKKWPDYADESNTSEQSMAEINTRINKNLQNF